MNTSDVPAIGEQIRAERVRQGLTVRGLARDIGVSASLISQIETDKSRPSVSTLYAITTALGISIEQLFPVLHEPGASPAAGGLEAAEDDTGRAVRADTTTMDATAPAPGTGVLQRDRGRRVGPVVRPDRRERLTLDSGVTWELLGQVPGIAADFLRVTYPPGSSSSSAGALMRHTGTEYGYLTSGELVLTLGFEEHRLHAGDAISFESATPHAYRNDGTEPAVGVWFVLEAPG